MPLVMLRPDAEGGAGGAAAAAAAAAAGGGLKGPGNP